LRHALFHVERNDTLTLQAQIREALVSAVLSGQLPVGDPVPSTRAMAKRLGVSRNTVVLAYQGLVASGFLISKTRSGFYVHEDAVITAPSLPSAIRPNTESSAHWHERLKVHPSNQENIVKPKNWRDYPYPFVYGQSDESLFPISEWRECVRQALARKWLDDWTEDRYAEDDPMLIEQIRQRLLPRRGIAADADEILITLGAQNALYLVGRLIVSSETTVGMEDPGYVDFRNIMQLRTDHFVPIPVDEEGLMIERIPAACDLIYVTPSHQYPTTVTMDIDRRRTLLAAAEADDFVLVEDDYEFETNYTARPCPALKSLDRNGRVIYVGSLSKSLVPGLRIGYMVAPRELIREAKALRRLMLRHPPGNNQRTTALFLAQGHHDTMISRQQRVYRDRWNLMSEALEKHLPGWSRHPIFGGTSFWLNGPDQLDADQLAETALEDGIVIEPGRVHFADKAAPENYFRLGFSSIATERITPGIERLASILKKTLNTNDLALETGPTNKSNLVPTA